MAEYIERQKLLDSIIHRLGIKSEKDLLHVERVLYDEVKKAPAADLQPVVRCINCKYYEGLACCKLIGDCGGTNWFCGWGEPKEETC